MTKEDLAAQLTGHEYRQEISPALSAAAKEAGLVVVFGASDDLLEMRGAWTGEYDAWEGTELLLTREGVWDEQACTDHCIHFRTAYQVARRQGHLLEALWAVEGYPWMYKTTIPHVTFQILEDGELYCRGIIFAVADLETSS